MPDLVLTVEYRDVKGKKVSTLRNEGVTPVHMYGPGIDPRSLQCDTALVDKIVSAAGGNIPVTINLAGENDEVCFIREVQYHPVKDVIIHVDFMKVDEDKPVEIEVPPETLYDVADVELLEEGKYERPGGSVESIKKGAELIAAAKNPLLWAGGGVISEEASSELTAIAEFLQAPVITTGEGRGAISDRSHLSIGSFRFKNDTFFENHIDDHDLVIAVGTRLAYPEFLKGQKVLQIDLSVYLNTK